MSDHTFSLVANAFMATFLGAIAVGIVTVLLCTAVAAIREACR